MNKIDQIKKEYLASFASCLSTNHKSFSSNSLNNSSKINLIPISHAPILPTSDFNKVQSTKITLNHKKYSSQPKGFSLLDINDKVTNVRSTNLPIQYKRRSPEEIKQLFSNSPIIFNEKNSKTPTPGAYPVGRGRPACGPVPVLPPRSRRRGQVRNSGRGPRGRQHKTIPYQTDLNYLGPLLLSEGLIKGDMGAYGLYITEVDGEVADYSQNKSFWAVFIGDEYATTGADLITLTDGGAYALVYTIG